MSNPIAGSLNTPFADATVFCQKLRHYPWNVQGPKFFELHAKFEEIYGSGHRSSIRSRSASSSSTPCRSMR